MVAEQPGDTAGLFVVTGFGAAGLFQRAAQEQRNHRRNRTHHERNPPAPGAQFIFAEQLLKNHHYQYRQQLPANQRHVLERGKETALTAQGDLAHVGRSGAVFAAHRQALEQPRQQQQRRRPGTDRGVGRQTGDDQGAGTHHQHRDHHRILAAMPIGHPAKQPTTNRAHQKTSGKHPGGIEQLHRRIVRREKRRGKVNGAEGIDIEVEPFHQVARGGTDDGEDALTAFLTGVIGSCHGNSL
ncbi:hypothetical protein D3C77_279240 [compost metagenome]